MAPPPFDVDSSRHSYSGSYFRQRLKNIVGAYAEGKTNAGSTRGITEPPAPARLVEDRLAEEERINKVEAKDVAAIPGEEKLVLFPTYARVKPHLFHAAHHHTSTSEHVDVDLQVHGQVSIPHQPNAPLRRKDRLLLSVARQICGLPSLPSNGSTATGMVKKKSIDIMRRMSGRTSAAATPSQSPIAERPNPMDDVNDILSRELVDEPDLIDMSTPSEGRSPRSTFSRSPSLSRASSFAEFPASVQYSSTMPINVTKFPSPTRSNTVPSRPSSSNSAGTSPTKSTSSTWKNSHNFPTLDLATCHANLMERLAPFIARSVSGRLVTIKVYCPSSSDSSSDLDSRPIIAQRQFLTNEYGHFSGKLIVSPPKNSTPPDTWTITASLSGTDPKTVQSEVKFIDENGISLISDIDDTIKHTSILSGARELFRNTFVRDLSSMSVDGVREWYTSLTQMDVQIHYVSNSPYQCWPIISSFMATVGLPRGGSVQLKQYSGMISGILENAADKKRAGVEGILRDFPGRKFILVGDSGEQDLELYTEIALHFRGQVLGIFIRDVTTPLLNRSGSSAVSLPMYFETNGVQPTKKEGRLAQLRGMQWRRSQESVSTLSSLREGVPISNIPVASIPKAVVDRDETSSNSDELNDFEQLSVKDMEELGPLFFKAQSAGEGIMDDLPLRRSKTPPALHPRITPHRTQSMTSISSEPGAREYPPPPKTLSSDTIRGQTPERTGTMSQEDQGTRVKRVENWRRRLAKCRERLFNAETGVEIWTWRNGGDVESICEALVKKAANSKANANSGKGKVKQFEGIRDTVKEYLGTQM